METTYKYRDVAERVNDMLATMSPGDLLPKERELADKFGVSRATLRQALQVLSDDGRVYSIRGHGTFVSDTRISKEATLTSFSEDMSARGCRPGSRLLSVREVAAPEVVARDLELPLNAPVFRVERLRLADDLPMCLERVYLPSRYFPNLLELNLERSLYTVLAQRYRISIVRADQSVEAVRLTKSEAELLGVRAGSAALALSRKSADKRGRLVERARSIYRADRYDFRFTVERS